MPRKPVAWSIALGLIVAACTTGGDQPSLRDEFTSFPPRPTTAVTDPATTRAPVITPAPTPTSTATATPDLPKIATGRLVILNEDGDVAVLNPDGSDQTVITDAFAEGAAYFQPLWSPGSEMLSWAEASPAGFGLVTARADGSDRAVAGMPSPPFFTYWAPDGKHIAALRNGVSAVELKLVAVGATVATSAASGTPLYVSWDPEGDELGAHIGADRLVRIDTLGGTSDVGPTDAGYQAPHWISGGIVHSNGTSLVLDDGAGKQAALAMLSGPTTFVANPQSTLIAIQVFGEGQRTVTVAYYAQPEIPNNVVAVIDLITGEMKVASHELSVGFFWSPDGENLLILEPTDQPGHVDALVFDGEGTRTVTRFAPASSFIRDVLPFSGQYAQSYQLWSPDSTSFAFAGAIEGTEGIWVQPLDGTAVRVGEGNWVSWSDG